MWSECLDPHCPLPPQLQSHLLTWGALAELCRLAWTGRWAQAHCTWLGVIKETGMEMLLQLEEVRKPQGILRRNPCFLHQSGGKPDGEGRCFSSETPTPLHPGLSTRVLWTFRAG